MYIVFNGFIFCCWKRLEKAIAGLDESVEHRLCVKHLCANFRKKFPDNDLKNIIWEAARATTVPQFDAAMEKLKALNERAWKHLNEIPPSKWSRSAYSTHTKCHLQENNMCEAFNRAILRHRDKPIIQLVEGLRHYIMERTIKNREKVKRYHGILCPQIRDLVELTKVQSNEWTPRWAGDDQCALFEVEKKPDQFIVNLAQKTYSCRVWDLTGIPCCHSMAAMAWCNYKPEDLVSKYYSRETYLSCYQHIIHPINGPKLWPKADMDAIQPPKMRRQAGRPKKMRKKASDERAQDLTKLPRHHSKYKCAKCLQYGHNKRSCKGKTRADREIPVGGNRESESTISMTPNQHTKGQASQPLPTHPSGAPKQKPRKRAAQQGCKEFTNAVCTQESQSVAKHVG